MVGPMSSEERQSKMRRLKAGVGLLVGLSGGLVALQGDASPLLIGGAVLAGTALGLALAWYVFPDGSEYR